MIQFQNLRQGSQVYILHKGLQPYYEVGTVESIPSLQTMSYYQNLPMMPLDLSVRVGGEDNTLPAHTTDSGISESDVANKWRRGLRRLLKGSDKRRGRDADPSEC